VSPALVGLLYGLSNVVRDGGLTRTDVWIPAVAGVVLMTIFVITQVRRPGTALIDLGLLRSRPIASSSVVLFLSGASLYGSMLLLPLYFQIVRGTDALTAALLLIPQGVGALASRTLAGRLTDSAGARLVAIGGFAILGAATIPFALADATTNQWWLTSVLLIRGFGMGAVMIPVMSVAFVGLQRHEVPHASTITRLTQQLGGAFGTATLAIILEAAASGGSNPTDFAHAFDVAFWWAVGFTAIAIGVCLALPSPPPTTEPESGIAGTAASHLLLSEGPRREPR
jgi:MFS family permease